MKKLLVAGLILSLFVSYGCAEMGGMQGNMGHGHEMMGNQKSQIGKGKELYDKHCSACHGENAVGQDPENPGGWKNPEGKIIAPALNGSGHASHHSTQELFNFIKKGIGKKNPPMPIYEKVLSDEEIHLIIDYFQSLWPKDLKQKHSGH